MVVGLFLQATQGQRILQRIQEMEKMPASEWESTGPTREDILAANKIENRATEGSPEEKLIHAVKSGDLKNVEALLDKGVDLEATDNEDMTALMIAVQKGYIDIVKALIAAGDATDRARFNEILLAAVYRRDTEMVKALIVESARIDNDTFDAAYSEASRGRLRNPEFFNFMEEARNKRS